MTLYSALTEALQEVPPTREEIIAAQRADTRLYKIIQFLQNGKFAKDDKNNHDIKSESRGYLMDGDMLVYFVPLDDEELDNSGNGFKAAIPRTLVCRALFASHGHPMSGHGGITKTKYRAKQLYYWKRMSKDVRNYVRSCSQCQVYKPRQQKVTTGKYTPQNMSEPWETVAVDLMGPKPSGVNQYKWLLVILDNCTKYVELFPLSTATGTIFMIKAAIEVMCTRVQKNYERHRNLHHKKYNVTSFEINDLDWKNTQFLSAKEEKFSAGLAKRRDVVNMTKTYNSKIRDREI
uniref:RNA-directed DNA polymerase n=1 Tax=Strigamia maritima TaxID=126957 RepID=T1IK11_STRMM